MVRDCSVAMAYEGTVKWFWKEKGYGWITPDAADGQSKDDYMLRDLFVHVKACPAMENAWPGEAVKYDYNWEEDRHKKWNFATNVSMVKNREGDWWADHGRDYDWSPQFSAQDRSKSKIPFSEQHFFEKRFVYF